MATARIEAHNRWDALALARDLAGWRWYLVSRDSDRWDVVVDYGRRPGESELLAAVQRWATRRHVDSVVHDDSGDIVVHPAQSAEADRGRTTSSAGTAP
jgi:hypothetical protein